LILSLSVGLSSCSSKSKLESRLLEWQTGSGFRFAKLETPHKGRPGFEQLPASVTGIQFTNTLSQTRAMNRVNLMNGSGVALGDYDGDGYCDVYLCQLSGPNLLYRNLGNWQFEDVTELAGVACPEQTSTGACFADINGDASLDLLVTSMGGPNACFINDGKGNFQNVTKEAGLQSRLGSTSMALADIEGDGDLDLYVCNYGVTSISRSGGSLNITEEDGKYVVRGRYARRIKIIDGIMYELGEPDYFYLNDGTGVFTKVSWTDGAFLNDANEPLQEVYRDQGLTVTFRDVNQDGAPDIYVCNDAFTPDRFWINDGQGRFKELNKTAWRQTSYFSMSCDFADINRDNQDDLFVSDMLSRRHDLAMTQYADILIQPRQIGDIQSQQQLRRNTLSLARGDGSYAEIAYYARVAASEWTWAVYCLDVDLDGWEDILVTNGMLWSLDDMDTQAEIKRIRKATGVIDRRSILLHPPLNTPNIAFRNCRDLSFEECGVTWGFDSEQVSNGIASADLDNDGDLDLVVNCLNSGALVYRNLSSEPRLAVRLRGADGNTQGIGARIEVHGVTPFQSQEVICGGRYMSGADPLRVFATGSADTEMSIRVRWRSGTQTLLKDVEVNHIYEIREDASEIQIDPEAVKQSPVPLFSEVSESLNHRHHETVYDDYSRQPALPFKLSQAGPGVAWFDLNQDGWQDIILGSGRGGTLQVFQNNAQGGFELLNDAFLKEANLNDQTGILAYAKEDDTVDIIGGSANYEDVKATGSSVVIYDLNDLIRRELPGQASSSGPLAMADIDGDSDLDLFVGGQCLPGRYPEAASSMMFSNVEGQFQFDQVNSKNLSQVGLVNGAVFSDIDSDGDADLLLARDWNSVAVFRNEKGILTDVTQTYDLAKYLGRWNGINTGDFNNDGLLDIVVSNCGRNTPYERFREHTIRLYYGDLDKNGIVEMLEAHFDERMQKWAPFHNRERVATFLPFVLARFPKHVQYAEASVQEIFGDYYDDLTYCAINTVESMLFINQGGQFKAAPLPWEAQISPCYAICVGDCDGDGHEDIFLGQNFFMTSETTTRYDAGRGVWLRGNGKGEFAAIPAQESGVKVYGEQKGAALADYNADGRIDLLVTQNGAATKLFRNERALPGLRIRLRGGNSNPYAIGASVRLVYPDKEGPLREIHAGAGYWSQSSPVIVLGKAGAPTAALVRWPDGQTSSAPVSPTSQELVISKSESVH
jgi:enediyne biosynthesis protein E4